MSNQTTACGIMQPYLYPYIGYFQMVQKCNKFIYYDDVSFIKKGWINRNRIRSGSSEHIFVTPVTKASQNRKINETFLTSDQLWINKLQKSLDMNYSGSKNYEEVSALVMNTLTKYSVPTNTIADLAIASLESVISYFDLPIIRKRSSMLEKKFENENRSNRLINISKSQGCTRYINSIGGKKLYSKEEFKEHGIELCFLNAEIREYQQTKAPFIKGLSIIDLLMNCSKDEAINHISAGRLI